MKKVLIVVQYEKNQELDVKNTSWEFIRPVFFKLNLDLLKKIKNRDYAAAEKKLSGNQKIMWACMCAK